MILVQVAVIDRLSLGDKDNSNSAVYVRIGLAEFCRGLMERDSHVRKLLKRGRITKAARVLTKKLRKRIAESSEG